MKTILIANQKGGVGKSMLADELAFSLARTGTPFSFYDLDGQGGTIHTTQEMPGAAAAVVDTPGALQSELRDWLQSANVVLYPRGPRREIYRRCCECWT